MKIGFFTDSYYPQINGVTISVDNFAQQLRKKGHRVYIFAPKIKNFTDKDKDVLRLASYRVLASEPEVRFPLLIPNKKLREMLSTELDLVHAHGNGAFSFLGYEVAQAKGIPFIMTFHSLHTKYTHYIFNGRLVKPGMVSAGLRVFGNLCQGVLTPSEKMKKELVSYGVKKKIEVLPNFIDLDKFKVAQENYFLHDYLKVEQSHPLILSVGRLGIEKNFEFVIKVFAKLIKKKYPVANLNQPYLVFVGQGPQKDNLIKLATDLGVGEQVFFTGSIDNNLMPQVYQSARVFVFASTTETQGLCVLEAIAAHLPVVVVNDSAFTDMVVGGKNGYLLPLKQNEFLAKIDLLLKNPQLSKSFAQFSSQIIETNFSPSSLTEKLIAFYESVLTSYDKDQRILSRLVNKKALLKLLRIDQLRERLFS